jgi:hypothetical protein
LQRRLEGALADSVDLLAARIGSNWRLPLSGGMDSRGILLLLRQRDIRPRCITWGDEAAVSQEGNDAQVAASLAAALGTPHEYFALDAATESAEQLVDRFIRLGDARVDSISGYMDGFETWRRLFVGGVDFVIRGDEGFGWSSVGNEQDARIAVGLTVLSDFFDSKWLSSMGLKTQSIPGELERRSEETVAMWRDRLYHQFRIPVLLAALNELKTGYVEISNPLLDREVIGVTRTLPDRWRTEKRLFRDIVKSVSPPIPYAHFEATRTRASIFRSTPFRELMRSQLQSREANEVVPEPLRRYLIEWLGRQPKYTPPGPASFSSVLRRSLPSSLTAQIKRLRRLQVTRFRPLKMDSNVLAFRACLLAMGSGSFAADARFGASLRSDSANQ